MRRAVVAWALAAVAASHDARAEDANRVAAATLLFDEGVRALDAGNLAEACEKLQKSQDLAPSGGTLLAIAECQERSEHFASAWVAYRAAAARAHAAGKTEAEAGALDHAAKLEPKLAQITLKVATPQPDLELARDGTAMTPSELGVAIPVDPGRHEFRARVSGVEQWSRAVTVEAGTATTIDVPPLAPAPKPEEPPVAPAPADEHPGRTQRIVGIATAGAGVAALGVSAVFYGLAVHNNDIAKSHCHGADPVLCDQRGLDALDDATHQANVTTGLFIGGAVLLAGGVILYLTAPHAKRAATDPPNLIRF